MARTSSRGATAGPVAPVFRFDKTAHVYYLGETRRPSITQMLQQCGLVSDWFYSEDSAERGHAVHELTAQYDLGAIEQAQALVSRYKPWLLAHQKLAAMTGPVWAAVEEPFMHPVYHYGGRPDRIGALQVLRIPHAVVEIKTGPPEDWHGVQTALQDLLVPGLPPGIRRRYGWHIFGDGKCKLIEHKDRRDYDKAREVIRACCR